MKKKHIALIIGLLLCGVGLFGWIYQIMNGPGVTNLSNSFSWGLYIGTFEFFIGIASGGMLLFSIAYLFHVESLKPFTKLAAISSLGSIVAAGVIIVVDLGQPFRVMQMLLTPNFKSPLFWDLIVLVIYMAVSLVAFIIQVLPDTKKNQDKPGLSSIRDKRSRTLSFFALPYVVVMNAITSLLFSMQNAHEWWNSALLPIDSVAVAVAVGLSFMMLVCLLAAGKGGLQRHKGAFNLLAKVAGTALLAHFFFTIFELIPLVWNNTAQNKALLDIVFGKYGLLYAVELVLPCIAMLLYFTHLGRRGSKLLGTMNLFVIVGVFVHRMMLLLPAFNSIPLTISAEGLGGDLWSYPVASGVIAQGEDIFVTFWNYAPSVIEWCANLLPLGITIVVIAGAMTLHPILSGQKQEAVTV